MTAMTAMDEERLARLIRALPPAPQAWVRAAQVLPLARAELDEIVARAEADAEFHARLVADLEAALAADGYEPSPGLVQILRVRFKSK
jgi:regulator of protease activity HflC (stomatin/prohibitin superfamily)